MRLQKALEEFKHYLPLLAEVSNPALERRHWGSIFGILGQALEEEQVG